MGITSKEQIVPAKLSYTAVNANVPALGKTVYTRNELEWVVTKFGNGDVDVEFDVDDDDDGRGRVKYAQTDNSDDPDPLPGPKVVRKAGWMGRWLVVLELLLVVADLAAAVGLDDVVALSTLAAAAVDAVAVATTATAVAVVLDADEARANASAIICDAVVVNVVLL